jgi:hypothetical protein
MRSGKMLTLSLPFYVSKNPGIHFGSNITPKSLPEEVRFLTKSTQGKSKLVPQILKTIQDELAFMLPENFANTSWWKQLQTFGHLHRVGNDSKWRPIFVKLQAAIEEAARRLSEPERQQLVFRDHYTHTSLPASPLCEITENDMHPDIANDPNRKETVNARVRIMANILKQGIPVHSIYSKGGLQRRTEEAQERYKRNLTRYSNLYDRELLREILPEDNGATAIFQSKDAQETAVFMIEATQANKEGTHWKIHLTPWSSEAPRAMIEKVKRFKENYQISLLPANRTVIPSGSVI